MHTLYVRVRDSNGAWSHTFRSIFLFQGLSNDPASTVSRIEYFIDTDPGYGKGSPVELTTPRESVMKYFLIAPASLQPGTNTLYVRSRQKK